MTEGRGDEVTGNAGKGDEKWKGGEEKIEGE